MTTHTVEQSKIAHFFFANKTSAPIWFILRLYLGYEWLIAGWDKIIDPKHLWFGPDAGAALTGFINGALTKTGGAHPDVMGWYASFLQSTVLPHTMVWSNLVAVGEIFVGLGLIVGLFTGIAAFFGAFMNFNYLLAGTVSINPLLLLIALPLIAAHQVAGYWGLDRFARPYLHKKFPRLT